MVDAVNQIIEKALEDLKAQKTSALDVTNLSDVMDTLIITTGTSSRHVKSLAENVVLETRKQGLNPIGVEGMDVGEWVLVDYGDTVVHVMQQATRDFYELEKLWSLEPSSRKNSPSS